MTSRLGMQHRLGLQRRLGLSANLQGAGGIPGTTLPTPTFVITSNSTQNRPTFQIDAPFLAGDVLTLQSQSAGGGWASPTTLTHTITAAEMQSATIDFTAPAMANGTYDFRVQYSRGSSASAYAYANGFTINATSYIGPGDIVSTGWAAWGGLRGFNAAYAVSGANPAIDLVDQTGANPYTAKILFDGSLDTAGIAAWVSSKSVTTARIAKLYDQSGNGKHMVQATLASMPVYLTSQIGARPGIRNYSGSSGPAATALISTGSVSVAQPYSMSLIGKNLSSSFKMFGSIGTYHGIFSSNTAGYWTAYDGSQQDFVASDNAPHAAAVVFNGASSSAYLDGSSTAVTLSTSPANGAVALGASAANNFNIEGVLFEIGFTSTSIASQQAALVTNQRAYWGF